MAEEILSPSQISTWDGWKVLLERLNVDFELPKPRDDPFYDPVPPRVKLSSISVTGQVTVKFTKPIFQMKDITTRMIGKRLLAAKPFLDV